MLAFQIEIDGEPYAVAGADDWALLSVHVTAGRGNPEAPAEHARSDHVDLSVGGLSQPNAESVCQHIRWGRRDLALGSRITVTVVNTSSPSQPIRRYRSDHQVQEEPFTAEEIRELRWKDYLQLKKEFEGENGG